MMRARLNRRTVVLFVVLMVINMAISYIVYQNTIERKISVIESSALQSSVLIQRSLETYEANGVLELINSSYYDKNADRVLLLNDQGMIISSNHINYVGQKSNIFFNKDQIFNQIKTTNPKFVKLETGEATYVVPIKTKLRSYYLMIGYHLKNIKRNIFLLSMKYFVILTGLQAVVLILFTLWLEIDFLDPIKKMVSWKDPILDNIQNNDPLFSRKDEIGQLGVRLYRNSKNFDEVSKKLKTAEASFNQSQKLSLIGQMTASVAHEIKNPLAFVTMIVGSNIADGNQHPLSLEDLTKIKEACDRANLTLQELLSFSRQSDVVKKVDIHQLLNNLIIVNGIFLKHRNHVFHSEFSAETSLVYANPTKLQQIFTNLITNASDAVPLGQRGLMELRSFNSDNFIILSVSDNGSGIEEKDQTKIFKNFFTTKDTGHGTGLGMGIVNNLVSELNGSIWFETEVGKGSTFYVKLPLA